MIMLPIETLCGRYNSDAFVWQGMEPPMEVAERVALACACAIIGMEENRKDAEKDKDGEMDPFNQLLTWEVNGLCWALRLFEEQGYGYVGVMSPEGGFPEFKAVEFNLEWAKAKAEQHRAFLESLSLSYGEKAALRRSGKMKA